MANTLSDTIGEGRSKADYSQTVSEPSGDFTAGHQSGPPLSQAIGGALSGLADIFSVGLKVRDEDMLHRERLDLTNKLNTYVQANAQGKMTRDEMLARSSGDVVSAINRTPRFAEDIRKTAQENLGLNPQAAQVSSADWQEQAIRGAKVESFNAANKAGLAVHKDDGSVDFDKSVDAGDVLQKQTSDQARYGAFLEGKLRERELSKGTPLTEAEKNDEELNLSKDMINPVWSQTFDSMMSRFEANMTNVKNMPEEKARAVMLSGLNKDKLNFQTQLQTWKMNTHMSAKTYTDMSALYDGYFKNIEDSFQGPMADWTSQHQAVLHMADKAETDAWRVMPGVIAASKVLGPAAMASLASSSVWQNAAAQTGFGGQLTNYINNVSKIADGTYSLAKEQDPTAQAKTLTGALVTFKSYATRSDLSSTEVSAAANVGVDTIGLALQSKNPDDLIAAQGHLGTPEAISLLEQVAADPKQAEKAQTMGAGMYEINTRAVLATLQKMGPETGPGWIPDEYSSQSNAAQELGAQDIKPPATFTPVYDPNLGRLVLQRSGVGAGFIPASAQKKLDQANQMLANITKLKEYGPDQDKALKDSQLKYYVLTIGGIRLKDGTQPPEMPGDKKEPAGVRLKKTSAEAVKKVESNGNPNAVSPKGATGAMQTMPGTLKDPGFGVIPAKDNSPAEMERVGVDYLHALEKHYENPTTALAAYNWGPKNVDDWLKHGAKAKDLPAETKDYVIKVMQERFR